MQPVINPPNHKALTLDKGIEEKMLLAWEAVTSKCATAEHVHRYYEMIFNFSEIPMRHVVADHTYHTNSLYILFRSPYILHTSTTCGTGTYHRYSVIFHHNVLTEFGGICKLGMLSRHLECLIPVTPEQMQTLEPLLQRLCRSQDPAVPKHMWIGSLASLLFEVNELAANSVPHAIESPSYMQKLLQYISEHLDEPLSLDSLAEKFFVSRAKLTKDFRATVKTSLHEYVTEVRLHRAKILLREGVPIPIISQQCGYTLKSSFIYMFHTRTGMTPGEYRKKYMNRVQSSTEPVINLRKTIKIHSRSGWYFNFGQSPTHYWLRTGANFFRGVCRGQGASPLAAPYILGSVGGVGLACRLGQLAIHCVICTRVFLILTTLLFSLTKPRFPDIM